jgi:hypothetical protein
VEDNQADFQTALAEEFGFAPEAEEKVEETPEVEEKVEETPVEEEAPAVEKTEEKAEETPTEEKEDPKFATKQDVLDAMKEYNSATTDRIDQVSTVSKEIIDSLHPEGIDRNIYDTNGNVIKTAQDIVDRGLTNERTGDTFTYEEAASFVLEANRQMDVNIKELNDWAGDVAEKNINLLEGNNRVMSKWGETLEVMPKLRAELAKEYMDTQIEFDKTNSYITRMVQTPEQFYDRIMTPWQQLGNALAVKEMQAQETQTQTDNSQQNDRMGLPPQRGQSDMPSNTGDRMVDALIDEMNKG